MDHFDRLGIPRRFFIDLAELERQYLARSREVHPDFHQMGGTLEQRASLASASALNEAYTVLRDPFRRAEYLLQLAGGPTPSEVKEIPMDFLEEVMELRMEIESSKAGGADSPQLLALEKRLTERRDQLLKEVGEKLTRQAEQPERKSLLREIRQQLNATKYVQGLLRDIQDI
jgi:molecular chaperone HscB